MAFQASVIADSISPEGCRLTTFELTYPRIVHAEMMTHRVFARNSASTRAIMLAAQLRNLLLNPFIPEKFGINQKGMQASRNLTGKKHDKAVEIWLQGRDRALTTFIELILGRKKAGEVLKYESRAHREYVSGAIILEHLDEIIELIPKSTDDFDPDSTSLLNVHKQLAGRGLEAYMWHTIVLTATEFDNFFALRDHPDAQGEIATIARLMKEVYAASEPRVLQHGQWHLPYVDDGEFEELFDAIRASVARTAATSYNRQRNKNPQREFERYADLLSGGHMSPFEHQGTPFSPREWEVRRELQSEAQLMQLEESTAQQIVDSLEFSGSFRGWTSHRKQIPHEANFGKLRAA